jgi:hypothetical protein
MGAVQFKVFPYNKRFAQECDVWTAVSDPSTCAMGERVQRLLVSSIFYWACTLEYPFWTLYDKMTTQLRVDAS